MKNQFLILLIDQFKRIFSNASIRLFLFILCFFLLIAIDINIAPFGKSLTLSIFNNKILKYSEITLVLLFHLTMLSGVHIFIPIGLASLIYLFLEPSFINYYLSRPVSRYQIIITNLTSVFLFFILVTLPSSILVLILLKIKSGVWQINILLIQTLQFILSGISIYALLLFIVIVTNSLNLSITLIFIHNFFLHYFLKERDSNAIVNHIIKLIKFILPPKVLSPLKLIKETNISEIIFPFTVQGLVCILVFLGISLKLYKNKEF